MKQQRPGSRQINSRMLGALLASAAISATSAMPALAQDAKFNGVTLNLASQNDQFSTALFALAPDFEGGNRDQGQCRHHELW